MSLYPLSTKKLIPAVSVVAIALLLAASLSQTVESAGNARSAPQTKTKGVVRSQEDPTAKARRFPNLDIRTEPEFMSNVAAANASSITQRLQTRKTSVDQAMNRLRTFSRGAQAKGSPLTGGVEVLRSTTGALSRPASGRHGADVVRNFISANSDLYGLSSKDVATLKIGGESRSGSGMRMVRVEQVVNGPAVIVVVIEQRSKKPSEFSGGFCIWV